MTEKLKLYLKGDKVIWAIIAFFMLLSMLVVYSATGSLAYRQHGGNTTYFLFKHLTFELVGLGLIFTMIRIPYRYYSRLSLVFLIISIPLLLYTLLKGANINSASRWIMVPVLGLTFQSSDFAKVALVMFLARQLSIYQEELDSFKTVLIRIVLPAGAICAFIMPANLSTAMMLGITAATMMFIGRIKIKHLLTIASAGIVFLVLFFLFAKLVHLGGRVGTWQNRIEHFMSKDSGNEDANYQVDQSKIAVVTGGFLGKGPGNSHQRNFLPHPYSDFIYAIIIEEYGMVTGILVLIAYLILLFRAGVLIRKCDRTFPAFLVLGLTLLMVFQAMINMAVAVNLFPVTGQTLPLISMGGSSLLFSSISFGIILSVSNGLEKQNEKNNKQKETEANSEKTNDVDKETQGEYESNN
jgi:cell division protein FtsW